MAELTKAKELLYPEDEGGEEAEEAFWDETCALARPMGAGNARSCLHQRLYLPESWPESRGQPMPARVQRSAIRGAQTCGM